MPLVEVEAASLEQDLPAFELTKHQATAMAFHGRGREPRQVGEGDGEASLGFRTQGQGAQARAKDNDQLWDERSLGGEDLERSGCRHGAPGEGVRVRA